LYYHTKHQLEALYYPSISSADGIIHFFVQLRYAGIRILIFVYQTTLAYAL